MGGGGGLNVPQGALGAGQQPAGRLPGGSGESGGGAAVAATGSAAAALCRAPAARRGRVGHPCAHTPGGMAVKLPLSRSGNCSLGSSQQQRHRSLTRASRLARCPSTLVLRPPCPPSLSRRAEIWSPTGGFFADPKKWKRNTFVTVA